MNNNYNQSTLSSVGIHPYNQQSGSDARWFFEMSQSSAVREFTFQSEQSCYQRTEKMARLEAALFVAKNAISSRKLIQLATLANAKEATQLIEQLNISYDQTYSAFRIERVAVGFQMLTRPQYSKWLNKLHQRTSQLKLSPSALETMTIVAYRQPVTRADVEAIRGVQCTEMLKQLMERGLIHISGEDDSLGRPYLYATTSKFLEHYGLCSLKELPMSEKLRPPKNPASEEMQDSVMIDSDDDDDDDEWDDEATDDESYGESA